MEVKWFVLQDNQISGPFSTEELDGLVTGSRLHVDAMVWWRGMRDWKPAKVWSTLRPDLQAPVANSSDVPQWYFENAGQLHGPYSFDEMLPRLIEVDGLQDARVWSSEFSDWKSIFEVPEIVGQEALGHRRFPRAPINGTVQLTFDDITLDLQLTSIGQGGFTAEKLDFKNLSGTKIQATIQSPAFNAPMRTLCNFVSLGSNAAADFEFVQISQENQSIVISYVNRYFDEAAKASHHIGDSSPKNQEPIWFVAVDGKKQGPLTETQLQAQLKQSATPVSVHIWKAGMPRWAQVGEVPELKPLLFNQKRMAERAAIVGSLKVNRGARDSFELTSISQTGVGIKGWDFKVGETFNCEITSRLLPSSISVEAEVVYMHANNDVGLKFTSIDPFQQKLINSYLEKFASATNPRRKAA